MGLPRGTLAESFYRAAKQRYSDAELLWRHNRPTGAIYLAGYGVECILKTLILETLPESQHDHLPDIFRGQAGHDLMLLTREFKRRMSGSVPVEIDRVLSRLNGWATNLRYHPGDVKPSIAEEFMWSANQFIRWADE